MRSPQFPVHLLPLVLALAAAAPPSRAEEFAFENEAFRLVLDDAGRATSLALKPGGRQLLAKSPAPFWRVKREGRLLPAESLARAGDALHVMFAGGAVKAAFRIAVKPRHVVFELAAIEGAGVEAVQIAGVVPAIQGRTGGILNVRWDDESAVCVMGLSERVHAAGFAATVYPDLGMKGEKAALVAAPTARFRDAVQEVEREHGIPTAHIGGAWAKSSEDVRRGYFFSDMTEANADETIRHAKLGGFQYILVYSGTWSTSLGSYPVNTNNFPRGEASLKDVIDKCHAAGLKVGMHMLTSFIAKNDPLVTPKPDPRLLSDRATALAAGIDAAAKEITADGSLADWPGELSYHGAANAGLTIRIDDELIQYSAIGGPDGRTFLRCRRGFNRTAPAAHSAGAPVRHLAERYGSYLVDLRTSLKDDLAARVAGLIDRCGFDMIYFDGGECNNAIDPARFWYWVTHQQLAVFQRVKRDLFVQGSGFTHWSWHFFSRGACDDFAAIATKQYLDYHKIGDSWRSYTDNFMPAELGWWGFLAAAPHHPATSPDEVEFHAIRMLALDCPISLETHLADLRANGRTEEMLDLLGRYERVRLAHRAGPGILEQLRAGEWRMTGAADAPRFQPVRYDTRRVEAPGAAEFQNTFGPQPAGFRLQAVPRLAAPGDPANLVLFQPDAPLELPPPAKGAAMPGARVAGVAYAHPLGEQTSAFLVGPQAAKPAAGAPDGKPKDLLRHRAIGVTLRVDRPSDAVLNVQLEAPGKMFRDHYIDLDFSGERTVVIPEPDAGRMLAEFRPAAANYSFKLAGYSFQYGKIMELHLRWMRLPAAAPPRCTVLRVEALEERDAVLEQPVVTVGGASVAVPASLRAGDYAECLGDGPVRIFDANGKTLRTVDRPKALPLLQPGANRIAFAAANPAAAKFTLVTLGEPVAP